MPRRLRTGILLFDLACIAAAMVAAYLLRTAHYWRRVPADSFDAYFGLLSASLLVWTALFFVMHLDGFRRGWHLPAAISQTMVGAAPLSAIVLAYAFLTQHYYSRFFLLFFFCFAILGFALVRIFVHVLLRSRLRTSVSKRVLIIGSNRGAQEISSRIVRHPELMLHVVGMLSPSAGDVSGAAKRGSTYPSVVSTLGIRELLREHHIDELIAVMPLPQSAGIDKLMADCRKSGIRTSLVPQMSELYVSRPQFLDLGGLPLVRLDERIPDSGLRYFQRPLDLVLALSMCVVGLPIAILAASYLYARKGTAFSREQRCGKSGHPFWMYRFNINRYDPDLNAVERLLAHLSITELPQLLNVLLGDMALVGPRPESQDRVNNYSDWQRQRLLVRPGLTGLAQVHGLREQHSSDEKARFDMQYIFEWSPLFDLALILQTVWTLAVRLSRHSVLDSHHTPKVLNIQFGEVGNADRSQSGAD